MYRPIKKLMTVQDSIYLRLYPELARFQDAADRKKVLTHYRRTLVFSPWGILIGLYFLVTVVIPLYFYLIHYLPSPNPSLSLNHQLWVSVAVVLSANLFCIGGFVLAHIPLFFLTRKRVQEYLRRQLHKRGVPICLRCCYNLTGCPSDRCPECGTVISRSHAEE